MRGRELQTNTTYHSQDDTTSQAQRQIVSHPKTQSQTREEILEDLQETTRQYLSCVDPTEAAARRLRVQAGDARGEVEETVTRILEGNNPPLQEVYPSTPVNITTPQNQTADQVREELHEVTMQYLSCADPTEAAARRRRVLLGDACGQVENTVAVILAANAPLHAAQASIIERGSENQPEVGGGEQGRERSVGVELPARQTPQRRANRPATTRLSAGSPNILRGASSRKRNMSSIRNSPARRNGSEQSRTRSQQGVNGSSARGVNPAIQLIPARMKKKEDFQVAPHPVP